MSKIFLPPDTAIMFIKCDIVSKNICYIPEIVMGRNNNIYDNIISQYVKSNKSFYMSINDIAAYYHKSLKITREDFMRTPKKYVFFSVDFMVEQMINLQYILVLDDFFRKNDIIYYLILDTDNSDNTYFKIYHYFAMRYKSIYSNVYIRTQSRYLRHLPQIDINYMPGEILPYFNIDFDLYRSCYNLFEYKHDLFTKFKTIQGNNKLEALFKQFYSIFSNIDLFFLRYIYSCLVRQDEKKQKSIIDFLLTRPYTPLLSMVLFFAIINRSTIKEYDVLYENCLDYTISLEQLIENSFFYAGNGILSLRIHQTDSLAMSSVCKDKDYCSFLLEVSLIDFQEENENRSLISQFIEFADADENEKEVLKNKLHSYDGLKLLFQNSSKSALKEYFEKPNIIIQHYGLQTIGLLAKKAYSLLCVRSGKNYYTNKHDDDFFYNQKSESYTYKSGVYYRLIIPIFDEKKELVYIGFNSNKYTCTEIKENYNYFDSIYKYIYIPKNREEKVKGINNLKKMLLNEYQQNRTLVVNAKGINSRIQLEYVIKSVLGVLYEKSNDNSVYIAIINLKNKTFIKLMLRFIVLCYNRRGTNEIFRNNELFLSTEDCETEILISGETFNQIINNLSSQRVFGTIDDDVFREMQLTLEFE